MVRDRIRDAGFTSWIDLAGIQAGQNWRAEIDQAIRESLALIAILTPAAHASNYVTYEWAFALGAGIPVIPLLLQATEIHPRLAELQHLDFTQRATRPWPSLLEALQQADKARPLHSIQVSRNAPPLVKEAIAALDNPDQAVMAEAVLRLAEMNLPEAQQALIEALNHPLPDVRIEAAWQLAARGDARAVAGLIEGNRRRQWHSEFARKIAEIGPPAVPALLAALPGEGPIMRRDLVWALEGTGDPGVVQHVAKLLDAPEPLVRQTALNSLKNLGTKEAMAAIDEAIPLILRDLNEGSDLDQNRTAELLEQLGNAKAQSALAEWKAKQQ